MIDKSKLKTYKEYPEGILINGDCLEVMPLIKDGSVDAIICDLPYGLTENKWDSVLPLDKIWEEYRRLLKVKSIVILFGAQLFMGDLINSNRKWFKYDLIWDKGGKVSGYLNAKIMPLRSHENILVFYEKFKTYNPIFSKGIPLHGMGSKFKNGSGINNCYGVYNSCKNPSAERVGDTNKYPRSILKFNKDQPSLHPTQKPVSLLEYLIRTYTDKNDIVLDNCMGSGTTCISAVQTGRRFIGIEKESKYYNICIERMKNVQLSLF